MYAIQVGDPMTYGRCWSAVEVHSRVRSQMHFRRPPPNSTRYFCMSSRDLRRVTPAVGSRGALGRHTNMECKKRVGTLLAVRKSVRTILQTVSERPVLNHSRFKSLTKNHKHLFYFWTNDLAQTPT